jgi:hypothetical protein
MTIQTIRSTVTGTEFSASEARLYVRVQKHVDDEVWENGMIPAVDSAGKEPYGMATWEPGDEVKFPLYMLVEVPGETSVYEPCEVAS